MLIVSLWALAILSMISIGISSIVSPQIKLVRSIEERFASQVAAEAALKYAFFERISEKDPDSDYSIYDSLPELNAEKTLKFGKVLLTYKLIDEESKIDININTVSEEMIMRLPGLNGDSTIAGSIIAYQNNKKLTVKEELLLVEGVTPEAYSQFKDFITVWTAGMVNINTVSEEALRILGFSDSFINSLIKFRNEDGIFKKSAPAQIRADLEKIISVLSQEDGKALGETNFVVKSSNFQMIAEAKFQNLPSRKYHITFDTTGKVLRWQED
ncbi:MAG: helix-hairpin-helix domain-containing protein [Candidatus Omnitrophota bacterium]|nr:helix-hairpin-helix domain-containing protein [Candidatus Omnitrophota bacterium]